MGAVRRTTTGLVALGAAFWWLSAHASAQHAENRPRLHVNQLGYLPDGPKRATLVTEGTAPLPWRLLDGRGATVLAGETTPRGVDPSAGVNVHTIDFGEAVVPGKNYVLEAEGERSHPFSIEPGLYSDLARDALGYFYPVRSGIAVDGAVAGEAYARPAVHAASPTDGAPNKGDRDVPCLPPDMSRDIHGQPWTCGYTLDVTGGWYDAGDLGKYVVNGGISVAQLMHAYERALVLGDAGKSLYADGALAIPESGNGVPDILDEARWELEFLMKMQVPEGEPLAGMAHHKVHGDQWSSLSHPPIEDDRPRYLHRPSTAATLNLAAAAAQASRLFRPYDPEFADRLLDAAERAYAAARAHPDLYAPENDNVGGGPYDDEIVSDEFYWAAAELFLTTGAERYRDDLAASPHFSDNVFLGSIPHWADMAALGRLSLALVPSNLDSETIAQARRSIVEAADRILEIQASQPFGHVYAPDDGKYGWGSNHLNAQNAIVLSRAYDLTGKEKYRDGALEAADYLLGRNALGQSYITGYGTVFSQNQHSSWFAHQLNPDLPPPPNGALAGGANSYLQDSVARDRLAGCAPQLCYVDDVESWSTNEVAINWNAALAQFAAFLADQ